MKLGEWNEIRKHKREKIMELNYDKRKILSSKYELLKKCFDLADMINEYGKDKKLTEMINLTFQIFDEIGKLIAENNARKEIMNKLYNDVENIINNNPIAKEISDHIDEKIIIGVPQSTRKGVIE